MGQQRRPLILSQTWDALNFVLQSPKTKTAVVDKGEDEHVFAGDDQESYQNSQVTSHMTLRAGLLLFPGRNSGLGPAVKASVEELKQLLETRGGKNSAIDEGAILGLPSSALRELSLSSGSWVGLQLC